MAVFFKEFIFDVIQFLIGIWKASSSQKAITLTLVQCTEAKKLFEHNRFELSGLKNELIRLRSDLYFEFYEFNSQPPATEVS